MTLNSNANTNTKTNMIFIDVRPLVASCRYPYFKRMRMNVINHECTKGAGELLIGQMIVRCDVDRFIATAGNEYSGIVSHGPR